ncbi:MAG: carboxypeptidase-like regulatory domain-containing protein [Bacteroidia bacterium]
MKTKFTLLFLLMGFCLFAQAQIAIKGRVVNGSSGEPLPYVTIQVIGETAGAISDFDGYFTIQMSYLPDSLKATYLGYSPATIPVKANEEHVFTLYESAQAIKGIRVTPNRINRADIIMKEASKRKKQYNPEKIDHIEYESYTKVQLAVDNVSDRFKKRKLFKSLEPLFDTISSFTDSSSNRVLPVFVSETISDYYYRKTPRRTKEFIRATKIQGVGVGEESYVAQVLGSSFQQYNFYLNNLYILDKDFISPLSSQAKVYYNFRLMDSVQVNGYPCYQIEVKPKNPTDLVFNGVIWIVAGQYSIKQLSLEISRAANLNFIEKMKIQQEFLEVTPGMWLTSKNRVLVDISEPSAKSVGMIGLYYNSIKEAKLHKERELSFFEDKVWVQSGAYSKDSLFWDSSRHEQISTSDLKIYQMVDSLKNQPLIKSYVNAIEILVKGYVPVGKLELGPYHYLMGFNNLEGIRFRLGARTSPSFSKDFEISAYGAYGLKDEQFKYGVNLSLVLNRKKWSKIGFSIKDDIELIGITDEDFGTLALYDAFATFGNNRLNRGVSQQLWYEKELFKGYTQTVSLNHKDFIFRPIGDFSFSYYSQAGDTTSLSSNFSVNSIRLRGRLSHKEQFVFRRTKRISFGNLKAPVLTVDYTHGFDQWTGGDFEFDKIGVELWQFNSLANFGTFEYTFKAYKAFGQIPYPILYVMRGNQSIFSSDISYNLMSWFEFAADQYISLDYEHQFNGLILNRFPLIRQLKWRSFVNTKMVYGTMSEGNKSLMPQMEGVSNPNSFDKQKPYVEVGYGIENILRFIRIDFIHRLTYIDDQHPDANAFGIKGTAVLRF